MTTFDAVIRALEKRRNAIDNAIVALLQADIEEVKTVRELVQEPAREPEAIDLAPKKRILGPAARRAIGDATRARWAAAKRKRRSSL